MSGRAAKAQRREDAAKFREAVAQAHHCLHAGDVDGCHELLHGALGEGPMELVIKPLASMTKFDDAFRRLCAAHGVAAAYIAEHEGRAVGGGSQKILESLKPKESK